MTDAFDDADALSAPAVTDADRAATVAGLIRADLAGDTPDAVVRAYEGAPAAERAAFLHAWNDAMDVDGLGADLLSVAAAPSMIAGKRYTCVRYQAGPSGDCRKS